MFLNPAKPTKFRAENEEGVAHRAAPYLKY